MTMNIEKFTERARGFLQAASTIAIRDFHQQLTPEHLLKALLDDEEGAAAGLIKAAGGEPTQARNAVEAALAKLPKVQGGGAGSPQPTVELVRLLDAAEAAGLRLPYSCRAGICSTCRAQVTHGRVAMDRNQALEDWEVEAGYILCCQARPLTASVHITYDDV